MSTDEVVLSAFLVLSALDVHCVLHRCGPFVVLWSFRMCRWVDRQKTNRTTKRPRLTVVWPCPSSKGPKDQKDHASNTGTDAER